MKKKTYFALVLAASMALACAGCGSTDEQDKQPADSETTVESEAGGDAGSEPADSEVSSELAADEKSEGVMTYAEYMAADVDTEVVVETYVQAKQGWWEDEGVGKATFYTQDQDGAYFIYDMPCSEDEYNQMVPGTKIKVTGYKSEWSGEIEIIDATFEIEEGSYIAEAVDLTDLLGKDELIDHQNQFMTMKGLTVEDSGDGQAYLYKWDNSGSEGDDLYFNVSLNGETYTFTVESYLCDSSTDVYKAVQSLNIGDTIDVEGFLYWYEGVNPHITSVTVK